MSALADRYAETLRKIEARCSELGRALPTLIVISKNHPASLVEELYSLGARNFGENRDQEAAPKAAATSSLSGIHWHFVGQLQTNKVKSVLGYAQTIHSLDRGSLLSELSKQATKLERFVAVFIQLNLTEDDGRGGILPSDLEAFAEQVLGMPGLELQGVMGVASLDRDPRVDFETIQQASLRLQKLAPGASLISAGMSHDFEQALEFGATHLRIGTAITGNRNP